MSRKVPRNGVTISRGSAKLRKRLNRLLAPADIQFKMKRVWGGKNNNDETLHGFRGSLNKVRNGIIVDPRPKGVLSGYYPHIKSKTHGIFAWTPAILSDDPEGVSFQDPNLNPKWLPKYVYGVVKRRGGEIYRQYIDLDSLVAVATIREQLRRSKNER